MRELQGRNYIKHVVRKKLRKKFAVWKDQFQWREIPAELDEKSDGRWRR
jgi:hypothetical protein